MKNRSMSWSTLLVYFALISGLTTPKYVDASFFYPESFKDTSSWKDTYKSCESKLDPDVKSVIEELELFPLRNTRSANRRVKAVARPYLNKLPTPIVLEYPNDNDFVQNTTKTKKTLFFENEPKNEKYFVSYYFRRRELPELQKPPPGIPSLKEKYEVGSARLLVLSSAKFGESFNYLTFTGFEDQNNTQTSREFIFSEAVFLGAPGDVPNYSSHEVEGTRYPMEIYMYFSHPDCSLLECAYQLVILVEESKEDNEHMKPVVDAVSHNVRGLRIQEQNYLQKYNSSPFNLGQLAQPQKDAHWAVWYTNLLASHRAYRAAIDNRDLVKDLQETSQRIRDQILATDTAEPLIYEVRSLPDQNQKYALGNYSEQAHRVLNLVEQFLNAVAKGDVTEEGLEVLLEDFQREKDLFQKDLEKIYNNNTGSHFTVGIKTTDPLFETRTVAMKKFREEVAKIYNGMRVLTTKTITVNRRVHSAGFLSGLQAHHFGLAMARRVLEEVKVYKEGNYKGMSGLQEAARKLAPQVFLKEKFHVSWLLPPVGGHFSYSGSTPFPPCHTVARTVVFDHPIKMSRSQIEILTTIPYDSAGNDIKNTRPPFADQGPNERDGVRLHWDLKNHQWSHDDGVHISSENRRIQKLAATNTKINNGIIILSLGLLRYLIL